MYHFLTIWFIPIIRARNWRLIEVYYKDVIPISVDVFENSSVKFYCGSSSPVHWTYEPYTSPNFQPISRKHQKRSKYITLKNLKLNDSGIYYCNGTYQGGKFSTFFEVGVHKYLIPMATVVPDWVEITAGGAVTLTCSSDLEVEWFSKYFADQDKIIGHNSITLLKLRRKHSGRYFCRGTHQDLTDSWEVEFKPHVFHSGTTIIVDGMIKRIKAVRSFY